METILREASTSLPPEVVNRDRIRYTSEELIGRKNPNHQGYKSRAKRLTGDLGVLDFPSFWSSRPPDASSLDLPAV